MSRSIEFLLLAVLGFGVADQANATEATPRFDPDGTAHVFELAIPPSALVSPEFKEFLIEYRARIGGYLPPVPEPDASKEEWNEFDRLQNSSNIELLDRAKKQYAVTIEQTRIADVPAAIVTPAGGVASKNRGRVLINLRGGGFVINRGLYFGQLESIPVAAIGGFKVITLDYSQAPFHSYPAASADVEAVYRELLKSYSPRAIGIYGCSAGGLLAAQSVAWIADKKLPRPGAVGVLCMSLSPPPQATEQFYAGGDADAFGTATSGPPPKNADGLTKIPPYMRTAARSDPRAWPGAANEVLAMFPPTLFLVGTREGFMSTAIVDYAHMIKLGIDASLYVMEGAPHAAHVMGVGTPEAHDANGAIARFFDKHLAQ